MENFKDSLERFVEIKDFYILAEKYGFDIKTIKDLTVQEVNVLIEK